MKKYPLQAFLRVCQMREEQARRDLAKAREGVAHAREALLIAKEKHAAFKVMRPVKEKELFAAIRGRTVSQCRLDDFHADVKKLVDEELVLAQAQMRAEEHLQHMQELEGIAHKMWQTQTKEHAKMQEHAKIWKLEQKNAQEKAEEAEMEGA